MRDPRMEAFVQQVRAQTDILAVVQGYVPLKRKGNRYWGCCPFHNEKTASFSVVPADGFFYCFGCHAGGDVFKFISLMEHITPFEAIVRQAEQLGIEKPAQKRDPREEARLRELDDLRKVNALARDFFHNCLTMTRYGVAGRDYLAGRGITAEAIERYGIGFAPDAWSKLSDAFQKRGISENLLVTAGLAVKRERGGGVYDRFRNRVIIPIADERGRIVAFGGRALGDVQPKYLNTAETPVFNKRKLLFGLDRAHRAIVSEGAAIVVEGYMDAIASWEAGVSNVVAARRALSFAMTAMRRGRRRHCARSRRYAGVPQRYACSFCLMARIPTSMSARTAQRHSVRSWRRQSPPPHSVCVMCAHIWRIRWTGGGRHCVRCCLCSPSSIPSCVPPMCVRRRRSSFSMRGWSWMRCVRTCGTAEQSRHLRVQQSSVRLCGRWMMHCAAPDVNS